MFNPSYTFMSATSVTSCGPKTDDKGDVFKVIEDFVTNEEFGNFGALPYYLKNGNGQEIMLLRMTNLKEQEEFMETNKLPEIHRPPVLMMPGMYQDYTGFLVPGVNEHQLPLAHQTLEAGYDVWIASNRPVDKGANFDWADQGKEDLKEMIDFIKATTLFNQVDYIGYDSGATQMIYGMAHNNDYFQKNVGTVAAIGPCTRMKYTKN